MTSAYADFKVLQRIVALAVAVFGFAITAAHAQQNLGFEQSDGNKPSFWSTEGAGFDIALDVVDPFEGQRSLRMMRTESESSRTGFAAVSQALERSELAGDRIRFSAQLRTSGVNGWAGLFMQVSDQSGKLLYSDSMQSLPVTGTTPWRRYQLEAPLAPDATRVLYGIVLAGSGSAWIDSVEPVLVSMESLPPATGDAAVYLERVIAIMREHSIRRHAIDWNQFAAKTLESARGARSVEDAYFATREAVKRLGDGHSSWISPQQARRLESTESALPGFGTWISPSGTLLQGAVGYIVVPSYVGTNVERMRRFADELQGAVATLDAQSPCGWIVDLRPNTGGTLGPMLAGLGPMLGEGDLNGGIDADGTVKQPWWYRDGQVGNGDQVRSSVTTTYRLSNSERPIALLIGPRTASSGEAVALAFVGQTGVRLFGLPTSGVTTGNTPFTLVDGAILNLTVTRMTDRSGKVYDGPIDPDVRVEDSPLNTSIAEQATVKTALAWVLDQPQCN